MSIIPVQDKIKLMLLVLEFAKERQKEVNHLDIGNYSSEIYQKIIKAFEIQESKP